MGLKIADLLKWRDSVLLRNEDGEYINDEGKPTTEDKALKVYLRIIGDDDLQESYRLSRVASAAKRKRLEDKTSLEWKEASEPIMEADKEQCIVLIKQSRTSNLEAEARAAVERPELPSLDEFAVDPDAASLAEQEKFEAALEKTEEDYEKAVSEYIEVRTKVLEDELSAMKLPELRAMALEEVSTVLALGEFYAELFDQKTARGCYVDKTFREKAFDSVQEFQSASSIIKQQLIDAYLALEQRNDDVKN